MLRSYKAYRDYYEDDAQAPDGAFDLENSIWRNTKSSGELSKKYISYVEETFGATAENVSEDKITDTMKMRRALKLQHRGFFRLFVLGADGLCDDWIRFRSLR